MCSSKVISKNRSDESALGVFVTCGCSSREEDETDEESDEMEVDGPHHRDCAEIVDAETQIREREEHL